MGRENVETVLQKYQKNPEISPKQPVLKNKSLVVRLIWKSDAITDGCDRFKPIEPVNLDCYFSSICRPKHCFFAK